MAKQRQRGPGRPFEPGKSGNPHGLTAEMRAYRDAARELCTPHCAYAVQRLRDLLDSDDGSVVVAAAKVIMDRAWGKPAMTVDLPSGESAVTMSQLLAQLPEALAVLGVK